MSATIYKNTIQQLAHLLSYKFQVPVSFSNKSLKVIQNLKWLESEEEVVFPLSINSMPVGHLKIHGNLEEPSLSKVASLIQWTLVSLENIYEKYNIKTFLNFSVDPILLQDLSNANAIDQAHEIYENSSAQHFIRYDENARIDRSIFSDKSNEAVIFLSDLSALSKEDQLFLSHYLETRNNGPMVLAAVQSSKDIIQSLLDRFSNSISLNDRRHKSRVKSIYSNC